MHTKFHAENIKGQENLGYLGINRRIILKQTQKKQSTSEGADWIQLTQDKD
jgi:hypothetical protein